MIKLKIIHDEFFPNCATSYSANRLVTCVLTNILASTNDKMFSHITGCPNWAYATLSVVTCVSSTIAIILQQKQYLETS